MENEGLRFEIAYYSGTGGSALVAAGLSDALHRFGCSGKTQFVGKGEAAPSGHDILFLVFPVYSSSAPPALLQWVEALPESPGTPAVVVSVSGGGEIVPNTASRLSAIRRLEKKGYRVTYEAMIVMPSNIIVATKEPLAVALLEVLPDKVQVIADEVLAGFERRTRPVFIDRFLARAGEIAMRYTKSFGKAIEASEACDECGWCGGRCPSGNIDLGTGKPRFGEVCHMCLCCIYGCPKQALRPTKYRFMLVKQGYSLESFSSKIPLQAPFDLEKEAKGFLWSGVKHYLQ
ncbi:MAG: 4Fe-4S dicluster domain-containing protein [Eggerthellaceae bacterium]|nr:4Fe-4S dicluster domain-containing protein [Eggerthellaceae bacterium]